MKFQYFDLGAAECREEYYLKQPVLNTISYFYNTKQEAVSNYIFECCLCDWVIYLFKVIWTVQLSWHVLFTMSFWRHCIATAIKSSWESKVLNHKWRPSGSWSFDWML